MALVSSYDRTYWAWCEALVDGYEMAQKNAERNPHFFRHLKSKVNHIYSNRNK